MLDPLVFVVQSPTVCEILMRSRSVLLGPYPPPYGGVSVYISTLFDFIKNDGVELWTYGDEKIAAPGVFFVAHRAFLPLLLLRRGRRARIADSTHFLLEYPSLMAPVWVALKAVLGFEWIKVIHDGSLPARFQRFSKLRRALFHLSIGRVSKFVVVTDELQRWLREELSVSQEVLVIGSLLPGKKENPEVHPAMSAELSSYLNFPKRVCSIGAFIPDYGFDQVAEAVEQVRRTTGEKVGLVLLDGDFAADEDYRRRVLDGREWIIVLKNVPHQDVPQILGSSDVFVRAFEFESYGLSRVEAIWSGTPVIATNAGETRGMLTYDFGNREELTNHLTAVLFGPTADDASDWAERYRAEAENNLNKLRKLLTD
jgi:glycosyltransferase involved in cell wall biosynthesis